MKDQIRQIAANKELCSLYSNKNDTCSFTVGYIIASDDNHIAIQSVDENGHTDGICVKSIDEVFLIETDTEYIKSINQKSPQINRIFDFLSYGENNLVYSLLNYALKNNKKISLQLYNSGYSDVEGYISKIDKNTVSVSLINETNDLNGNAICIFNAITQAFCSAELEPLSN